MSDPSLSPSLLPEPLQSDAVSGGSPPALNEETPIQLNTSSTPAMDRLSELPDSLIFSIFEFLPMKSVVRTQLLSHRWKNLWTLTPYLNFFHYSGNSDVCRNFVNRCLSRWRGSRVQNFMVLGGEFDGTVYIDMDLWVRFAVNNGVQELVISLGLREENDHTVPQCLYSCSSLHYLELQGFNMDIIRRNVEWNQLKALKIHCNDVSAHAINQILCGCPLLEEFHLIIVGETERNSNLCLRSTSLKCLKFCKIAIYDDDVHINSQLEIWTPNVERLTFAGSPYAKCLLTNVSSLTEANISLSCYATGLDGLERSLSQILPAIRHVKELTLRHWCIKALENMKSKGLLSPLPNVKILTFVGSFKEHKQIVDLLEIFPKLKTLLVVENESTLFGDMSKSEFKFEPNPSKLFLEELTTVDVTCTKHDCSILPFVKSLLKHASKLEKMMLRVKGTPPPSLPVEKLLGMPRSSPTAELIFL